MNDFECHITLNRPEHGDRPSLEALALAHRFKTSEIAGDPVLGQKTYFYLTGHDKDLETMKKRMNDLAREVETVIRTRVVRKKIEQIVFDERYAVPTL